MKRFSLTTMITLILLLCITEIQAKTDIQAKKLIEALKANDCTNAKLIAPLVESVNYKDKKGFSLLIYSSIHGCFDVVKILLDNGADVNYMANNEFSALMFASLNKKNTDIVKLLLDNGAKVDSLGPTVGLSALMMASSDGNTEAIKLLLDNGAKVDLQGGLTRYTALIAAAEIGNMEVVKLLIDKGANIDLQCATRNTALMLASQKKENIEVVKLLLDNGANLDLINNDGRTALEEASKSGNIEVVNILKDKEKEMEAQIKANGEKIVPGVTIEEVITLLSMNKSLNREAMGGIFVGMGVFPQDVNEKSSYSGNASLDGYDIVFENGKVVSKKLVSERLGSKKANFNYRTK